MDPKPSLKAKPASEIQLREAGKTPNSASSHGKANPATYMTPSLTEYASGRVPENWPWLRPLSPSS